MRKPTPEEIRALQNNWRPRVKQPKPVSEASVQATCCEFLKLDGWRLIETDPKHVRGLGVSEPGIADTLAIRYRALPRLLKMLTSALPPVLADVFTRAFCTVVWIEWKRPKRSRTQQNQHDWHAAERARGGLTWKADEDFEPTIEGFCVFYNQSGLALVKRTIGAK